jgi:uncharacterized protein
MDKINRLRGILQEMGSAVIAYSGGVDSTLLLKVAGDVLGDKVLAVTAVSPTYQKTELEFSRAMAKHLNVKHQIIKTSELDNKRFVSNPVNRCYFCKKELFGALQKIAKEKKIDFVIDASNASDKSDYRPGTKAKEEFKIRSPLAEADLTKEEIRALSKKLELSSWDKPSLACLASRIPYGSKISKNVLERIYKAETVLNSMGFKQVRLRHYDGLCRIEVPKNDINRLINNRSLVVDELKKLGYNYITLDLEGYRTGSMNPAYLYKRN